MGLVGPDQMPEMSIVVTIVDGGDTLRACLAAIRDQVDAPSFEVLIPYDHISSDAGDLAEAFPGMQFMDLGVVLGGMQPKNAMEVHRFYDRRRAVSLAAARAPLIGMVEDRGPPAPNWAAEMVALHSEGKFGAVGGAVANGIDKVWNWAIFFCDFGRYQAPLSDDDPDWVTDTNICYRADALAAIRDVWEDFYEEPPVNDGLKAAGWKLRLTDRPVTRQRRPDMGLWPLLMERFNWAMVFARIRAREAGLVERLKYCLAAPLLPPMLVLRHWRRQKQKGHHVAEITRAIPAMLLLLSFWAAGEAIGTLTRHRVVTETA